MATTQWLDEHGVDRRLARRYCMSGWLNKVGHGAYCRFDDDVEWRGGLYGIQSLLELPVHVAACTALELQGYAHFLPMGRERVWLFGQRGTRLPAWFLKRDWGVDVHFAATALFGRAPEPTALFGRAPEPGLTRHACGRFEIEISAPERAAMEMLHLVPGYQGIADAKLVMEGLTTLRPRLTSDLLGACASVKVKRLFMVLAETCAHGWLGDLDLACVDFGHGKRVIAGGGQWYPKYGISLPPLVEDGGTAQVEQ